MSIEGKYQLVQDENFDAYLKEIGVGFVTRKLATKAKPLVTISLNNDEYTLTSESVKTFIVKFKLGQDFEEDKIDGGKYKSMVTMNGNKMVHKQRVEGKPTITMTREFTPEGMVVHCDSGSGVFSKRIYKRV